jgi:hypothetical protein
LLPLGWNSASAWSVRFRWRNSCLGERRTDHVKRRRHTPEQIVRKLRDADKMLADGIEVPEVCEALEVC